MAQATFSIRMDEKLKHEFDLLCADFGMNATTAFNVFARAVVRERRIPFDIQASSHVIECEHGRSAFMDFQRENNQNDMQNTSPEQNNVETK